MALVRAAITGTLQVLGVREECVDDIRLAVSEACSNVVQHAATGDEYEVTVRVDDQFCTIDVKNTGNGFDAASLAGDMPDPQSPRGRGVAIMRTVMDGFNFTSSPEAGTIVHLTRALSFRDDSPVSRLHRNGQSGRARKGG